MRFFTLCVLIFWGGVGSAQDATSQIEAAAKVSFSRMPDVQVVDQINGTCGADDKVTDHVVYCTSLNTIFVADAYVMRPELPYLLAHAFGHAVQVRHGVADIALRTIRARRSEEAMLRGLVDRQVDCIAGFLFQKAGYGKASLTKWLSDDPFDAIHWGRNPLREGPVMPVPLSDRDRWFMIGQNGSLVDCAVGEFGSALLVAAYLG